MTAESGTQTEAIAQSAPADLETRDMLLNIGPAHPAMHGIVRIVAKLDGEQIKGAVEALPSVQREAVMLAYFSGLIHREIAARTGVPLGTVIGCRVGSGDFAHLHLRGR